MPLSKSDERRSRSSKGDERLSKMGGSLVFKMGGSWAQRESATEPETGLTSVQKMRAQVHMAENSGNARSYAIDPRTSRFVQWWDMAMLVALIFTALATPYECVYLAPYVDTEHPLFGVNRVFDAFFLSDMVAAADGEGGGGGLRHLAVQQLRIKGAQQQLMLAQRAMLGAMHSLDGQLRDAVSAHAYEAAVVATAVRGAAEEKPKAPQPGGASLEA